MRGEEGGLLFGGGGGWGGQLDPEDRRQTCSILLNADVGG